MRILKYNRFADWAKAENISDAALKVAADELASGLFDANLGGSVYKKRVSREGGGKSGGFRTLIAFKQGDRAIFMVGFAKNERANISTKEKVALKRLAKDYLSISDQALNKLIHSKKLTEVTS